MRNHVGESLSRISGSRASNCMWNGRLCRETSGSPFPSLSAGHGQQGGGHVLGKRRPRLQALLESHGLPPPR